ncbi:MAG: hypothetical protein FP820_04645 [Sulfurimonas sp.]|jgi:hypothetical protein|nr:hypothetical protein [Sulfurimonas sp.]MBU1218099.1 hypothetical protein [bacterium]MBU1434738.1 hypothetical protein [bacterium]MBU1502726.1 hypothetical protein [bacterium]MBU3940152.1 hypothetical protein [bacterium]
MGIKKIFKELVSSLSIENFELSKKKKSLKDLLKKLKKRRLKIYKSLKVDENETSKKEFQDEIEIISLQIQKGRKVLKLLSKK